MCDEYRRIKPAAVRLWFPSSSLQLKNRPQGDADSMPAPVHLSTRKKKQASQEYCACVGIILETSVVFLRKIKNA